MSKNKIFNGLPIRLNIGNPCSLNCSMCSTDGLGKVNTLNPYYMDTKKLEILLDMLKELNFNGEFTLTGGEPTLHPDFNRIIDVLASLSKTHIRLLTNATIGISSSTIRKISRMNISIHSLQFRKWKALTNGTRQQFRNIIKNITSNKYTNKGFYLNIVLQKDITSDLEQLAEMFAFAIKFGFRIRLIELFPYYFPMFLKYIPFDGVLPYLNLVPLKNKHYSIWHGQKDYSPHRYFMCKNKLEVQVSISPCSSRDAHKECYKWHFIQITPDFKLKFCMLKNDSVDLNKAIANRSSEELKRLMTESKRIKKDICKKEHPFYSKLPFKKFYTPSNRSKNKFKKINFDELLSLKLEENFDYLNKI